MKKYYLILVLLLIAGRGSITTIRANRPCLIRKPSGNSIYSPVFNNVTIVKASSSYSALDFSNAIRFGVNYNYDEADSKGTYLLKNGSVFTEQMNGVKNLAFEAWIADLFQQYDYLIVNDGETDIDYIITGVSPLGETKEGAAIYNLSGQRLQKMQNGINIIGGHKVLK